MSEHLSGATTFGPLAGPVVECAQQKRPPCCRTKLRTGAWPATVRRAQNRIRIKPYQRKRRWYWRMSEGSDVAGKVPSGPCSIRPPAPGRSTSGWPPNGKAYLAPRCASHQWPACIPRPGGNSGLELARSPVSRAFCVIRHLGSTSRGITKKICPRESRVTNKNQALSGWVGVSGSVSGSVSGWGRCVGFAVGHDTTRHSSARY